jgi:hypothetical protein
MIRVDAQVARSEPDGAECEWRRHARRDASRKTEHFVSFQRSNRARVLIGMAGA